MLAAITASVVLATFAAAARSRTAFDRLREATHASDVALPITDGDPTDSLDQVRRNQEVIDARAMSILYLRPEGSDLFPTFDSLALAPRTADSTSRVDTPIITAGRAPRAGRADEVALSASLAEALGAEPGDELRLESMTREWVDAAYSGRDPGPPDGPTPTVTVTGIARSPVEFGARSSVIHLTAAFVDRHAGELQRDDAIHVRLEPAAIERHDSQELVLLPGVFHTDSASRDQGATEDGLETIATALRLVGLGAGVAGAMALVVALARAARASAPDRSTLVALGWTRWDARRALLLAHLPAVAIGVTAGVAAGVRASPWAMVDLARSIDPRPDAVLVDAQQVGMVVAAVIVVAATVLAVSALTSGSAPPSSRRVARLPVGPPLALSLGIRHALVAPPDRGGRASRGAIAAVTGATALGIAALVVSSSIARLQDDASLTGERPERLIDAGSSIDAFDDAVAALAADERVRVLAGQHIGHGTVSGPGDILFLIHEPLRGQAEPSVTAGRMPRRADEVALGPATVDVTGAGIGEEIQVSGELGAGRFRVVGTVLFPEGDFTYDEGVALTMDGGRRLIGDPRESAGIHQVFFDWAEGVDAEAADRALSDGGVAPLSFGEGLRVRPGTVTNLVAVEGLPRQLAALAGFFAVATLLHAVWTGVALRRRDLMTLRALGLTRRATALLSATHPIVVTAIGLLVGAPLGVLFGRAVWRPIAEGAHLVVRPTVSWSWCGLLVGTGVVAGLVVAVLATRWTGRLRPAVDLRAE